MPESLSRFRHDEKPAPPLHGAGKATTAGRQTELSKRVLPGGS